MTSVEKIIAQFPAVSKKEWLEKIQKDLKDTDPGSLDWPINEHIRAAAFAHPDDLPTACPPLFPAIDWEIDEKIRVEDPAAARAQALEALQGGADSLTFEWAAFPSATEFSAVLEGIYLEYISLNFTGHAVAQNPGYFLSLLKEESSRRNISGDALQGSLAFRLDDFAPSRPQIDWRYLGDLLHYSKENFPRFKLFQVCAPATLHPPEHADTVLATALAEANLFLTKLTEKGLSAPMVADATHFLIPIGKSYFVEIAKLRALKWLWFNILRAWELPLSLPFVAAHLTEAAYTDELYTNMISATTQSMSAVMGGVQRLTVVPYDEGRETLSSYPKSFARRMARNIQHLLKAESALHTVDDPAAGSYYIEQLTQQLATSAWSIFQQQSV